MAKLTWRDAEPGKHVLLKGDPWLLVANEKAKGGQRAVVVERNGQRYRQLVDKGAKVELAPAFRGPTPTKHEDKKSPPKRKKLAKPETTPERAGWGKAPHADEAEKQIREQLGGVLTGVQLGAGEAYVVPPVDPSTIASHLFLYHGLEPKQTMANGWESASRAHDAEHARPIETLAVPHYHDATRPSVAVGPRMR